MADFSIGDTLRLTLFGQSHGPAVGGTLDGYPAGRTVDWDKVRAFLDRRAPGRNAWSTQRREADEFELLSGFTEDGVTGGGPLSFLIRNTDTRPKDYPDLRRFPRPGHADFAADQKYGGDWDDRGGGHFSGRLTAPLCLAGALCKQYLEEKGIEIAAHIARIGEIEDAVPDLTAPALPLYPEGAFPVIDQDQGEKMKEAVENARQRGDSVDGAVRCVITGLAPGSVGGPWFGGLEGKISRAVFAIPAVKGVLFGDTRRFGSLNNDPYGMIDGVPRPLSNHSGGILGGIATGLPVYFTASFKPTPSISLPQRTVDLLRGEEAPLEIKGRHDPCVVPRAVPAVEAAAALVIADLALQNGNGRR